MIYPNLSKKHSLLTDPELIDLNQHPDLLLDSLKTLIYSILPQV